jgi:biotin carboxylase
MRSVIFAAPFLLETTLRFARAASRLPDVRLLAVVQEPPKGSALGIFDDFVVVDNALTAAGLIGGIDRLRQKYGAPHRIIGVLEPLQTQIAQARQHFGVPGTDVRTAELFRDKALMKDELRAANLPVAKYALLRNVTEAREFAARVGFPIVLKPPAGMGAKATFRVQSLDDLDLAVQGMGASATSPVLGEEFLRGEEGSFDTITIKGTPRVLSVSHYLPTPLTVLENPWIQWTCLLPREIDDGTFDDVKRVGIDAITALGLRDGFTHMEWFRREDGSVAIGEIAQRPPGAHITRMIGLASNFDPYLAWARAVVDGESDGPNPREFAVGCAYFRGLGRGRVTKVTGVDEAQRAVRALGVEIVEAKLPSPGVPKSDSYEGDGFAIVKHPDTERTHEAIRVLVANVRIHYA